MSYIAAVLKNPWNTKRSWIMKLLETLIVHVLSRGCVSIRIHCNVIYIFINPFNFLQNFRINLLLNSMGRWISAIWGLKFTDCSNLAVVWITKCIESMAIRCCLIANRLLLWYFIKILDLISIHISWSIEKIGINLNMESWVTEFFLKNFLWI